MNGMNRRQVKEAPSLQNKHLDYMAGAWAEQWKNGRRVAPVPNKDKDILEIRPSRHLHIKRLNPKERDEKFEKEMQSYLQYRENGLLLNSFPPRGKTQAASSSGKPTNNQSSSSVTDKQGVSHINSANGCTNRNEDQSKGIWISDTIHLENTETVPLRDTDTVPLNCTDSNTLNTTDNKHLLTSPSRTSTDSQGIHSVSNIQVSVTRPSSHTNELKKIGETSENNSLKNGSLGISAKSPSKTKTHRPVSGRSFRKSVVSTAISIDSQSQDVDSDNTLHLHSPYKDVTLFFIHGVGGCADVWHAQMQFFANLGIEVVAPDLIGHGFSCTPDSSRAYHFQEILADIEAVFDKFCKKQNVIIGHSYGCAFAAALGRQRARRVTKLVLVSGGGPIPLAPQPGVFRLPICLLSCIKPCLYSRFERNAFHGSIKDSGFAKELAFHVPVYVLSHMMNGQDWLDGDELYHQWLTMPTLLLHGKYDKFVTLDQEMEMEKAIYYSTLRVIDNASHMVMLEAPEQVNQLLYEFIFQSRPPDTRLSSAMETSTSVRAKSARSKSSKQLS